jgi:adenosylcobyric acid synthase
VLDTDPAVRHGGSIDIAVIALPRIANFDDFDPLAQEEGVAVRFVRDMASLGRPQAIILPGTKHTLADLAWLRQSGLAEALLAHAGRGGALVGICGGYQMLGREISDPARVEGGGDVAGLDLLPASVIFGPHKETWQARAALRAPLPWLAESGELSGYEIHAGIALSAAPLFDIRRPNGETVADGACSADGRIWGTHLHGLFHNDDFRRAWLASLGWRAPDGPARPLRRGLAVYDALADVLETSLDLARLDAIIGP